MKILPLHELFKTTDSLLSFVTDGRILFSKNGNIEFFTTDYVLKNDYELSHWGYGYSFEDDQRLSKANTPRKIIASKGQKVTLRYNMYSDYINITIEIGEYKKVLRENITREQYLKCKEINRQIFFENLPQLLPFNSIGSTYIWRKNGTISYSN